MPTIKENVINEYPQDPRIAKGEIVNLLKAQIAEIGVQGNSHRIFPLTQSDNEKIIIIKTAEEILFNLLENIFIKRKLVAVIKDSKIDRNITAKAPNI